MNESRLKPIKWDGYFQQLITLQIQFETARMALKGFGENPGMLKGLAEEQLKEIRDIVREGAQQKGVDPLVPGYMTKSMWQSTWRLPKNTLPRRSSTRAGGSSSTSTSCV